MNKEVVYKKESYKIIGACFEVYNEMGNGFLEAVYQECLGLEFEENSIPYEEKKKLNISYKNRPLKQYYEPDFLCKKSCEILVKRIAKSPCLKQSVYP